MEDRRSAKNFASTTIMRTLATSLNWNERPTKVTERCAPRLELPIARTTASRPSVKT